MSGPEAENLRFQDGPLSTELVSACMALMPDAALAVDDIGTVVAINDHAETLFDYPTGSLAGVSIETLVPERARSRHRQHRVAYASSPRTRSMGAGLELSGRRSDGSEFPIDVSLAPLEGSGHHVVVAAVRDLTEQRRAVAAQAQLATIVRSSLDAIVSTTVEGTVLDWNPAAQALLGYPAEDIVGRHISLLVPDGESIVLEELLDAAYQGSHASARDTRWLSRDGREIDVAVSISPMRDRSGDAIGFASIVRDIRVRKDAERELRRLLSENERSARQHAATAEIRLQLLADAPLDEVLELICTQAAGLVRAPTIVVCLLGEEAIKVGASTGLDSPASVTALASSVSFAEEVVAAGQPLEVDALEGLATPCAEVRSAHGPVLGLPIAARGDLLGALILVRSAGEPFTDGDRLFAEALAAQASIAVEFERARSERERMLVIGDRDRIAKELNDQVIRRVSTSTMVLQSALSEISDRIASERVAETISSLDDAIRALRDAIFSLGDR